MARILLDSTLLVEGEREQFDLGAWALAHGREILICDAGVTEFLAGCPVKDRNKEVRWRRYWETFVSRLPSVEMNRAVCEKAGELLADARRAGKTVPLGDGLHGAVAVLEHLQVATVDTNHFDDLGVKNFNPLRTPAAK